MKVLASIFIFSICFCFEKININYCNTDEIKSLPINDNKIDAILDYLHSIDEVDNIYQLLDIDQINANDIQVLKNHIIVKKSSLSDFIKNQ